MFRHFKAMVCAAVALAASPATAATYVTYTISGDAVAAAYQVSQTIGYTNTPGWFEAVFTIPVSEIRNGGNYYETLDSSQFGLGPTILGVADGNLTFESRARSRADSRIAVTACLASPLSALPTTAGTLAVNASCGAASLLVEGIESFGYLRAAGSVNSLSVSVSDVAPSDVGLQSFVFAVPEPSTWALMLAGFAMTGYALRRRRARVAFA